MHRAERVDKNGQRSMVALKRLKPELSDDRDFVESFVQEARLARLANHPNIARAYELGKLEDTYYIAMELVRGPTLQAVMTQSRTAAGAIPLPIIVDILIQLCDAVDHVHHLRDEEGRSLSLIHRDVSPANVILSNTGHVKLIDFGVAKAARSRVQTQAGFIKGKLSYVAPEYTHGHLDHRADLFAIGVIAHELLTGHRLFAARTDVSVVEKVRALPIQKPSRQEPRVTRELDDIVITALQRDPDKRWQNAAAMKLALEGVANDLGGRPRGKEIVAWVEWAFSREPWRDGSVVRILDELVGELPETRASTAFEAPTVASPRFSLSDLAADASAARAVRGDPTILDPRPPIGEAIARREPSSVGVWVVVLVLAALLAAAVWTERLGAVFASVT